jgi:hypothetical protein
MAHASPSYERCVVLLARFMLAESASTSNKDSLVGSRCEIGHFGESLKAERHRRRAQVMCPLDTA